MEVDLDAVRTWLGDAKGIPTIDEASVALVRERVREVGASVGLGACPVAALASVASELAHNQLRHAHGGVVLVREARRGDERGVEVVAADEGPGVDDIARALEGPQAGRASLGSGMAAVLELSDEVDIDVRMREGTCVWARKFEPRGPRRRRVGVFGRPFPDELRSGDDAAFARIGDGLAVCLADGLGHGEAARNASVRAARALLDSPGLPPDALVAACDRRLAGTRGAVMTAARIEAEEVTLAGVGNVAARAYGVGRGWRFGGSSFVLGSPGGALRTSVEAHRLAPRDVFVLFSDGVRSTMDLAGEFDLLREHPVVIAQRIVERFARPDDDVLVLVAG